MAFNGVPFINDKNPYTRTRVNNCQKKRVKIKGDHKMYTFNGGLSAPPLLSIDSGGGGSGNNDQNNLCVQLGSSNINSNSNNSNNSNIPRTPEILNSLIAMTNPLEYSYPSDGTAVAANNVSTSNQVSAIFLPNTYHTHNS